MRHSLQARLAEAEQSTSSALLAELGPDGHWIGELSGSALSTATAITALSTAAPAAHAPQIESGLQWLASHANADGGWGDTIRSRSNLSTTALVWAAFGAAKADSQFTETIATAEAYLKRAAGSLDQLPKAIEARYGSDRTFSIPIIMTLALSGRLGPDGWNQVRSLPFELAALPRRFFGALRLPVVSYAMPALIAIGQVIHQRSGRFHPLRSLTRNRTLNVLTQLQPPNGGFLEATPLTSFVTMSLAGMGLSDHLVAKRGVAFLKQSARADGCWPIDTNLSTWVTTLSVKALRESSQSLNKQQKAILREWLLAQQFQNVHPYTGAAPGAWSWSNLPGAVPDADDTAGTLLALWQLRPHDFESNERFQKAISAGMNWLASLQNRDGGVPTFCSGWGTLPFDRSTPELTAHALRAWRAWSNELPIYIHRHARSAIANAVKFLRSSQREDGAWIPLWFGNEHAPADENPVYGTAQVLRALMPSRVEAELARKAQAFLRSQQNPDGGWGGALGAPSTVEETSLAVEALAPDQASREAVERGIEWLISAQSRGAFSTPAPIGLYFAKLWYYERLYPLIFATSAFSAARRELFPNQAST